MIHVVVADDTVAIEANRDSIVLRVLPFRFASFGHDVMDVNIWSAILLTKAAMPVAP
jgi:hypothetical protein